MLLISRLLRRVGGEHEALFDFLHAPGFLVDAESRRKPVGLVEVPDIGIHPEFLHQPRAAGAQQNVLRDPAQMVVVVKPVGQGAGKLVVFLDVRG